MTPTPEVSAKLRAKMARCVGCRNHFYNGNNNLGIAACWSLARARVVARKEVHINQVPPWKQKAIRVHDCFQRPGYVYVGADQER